MATFSKFFKIATVAAAVAGSLAISTPAFAGHCGCGGHGGGFGGRGFAGHVGYGGWGWGWDDPSYYSYWGPYYGGPHYGDYPAFRRVNVRPVHRAYRSCIWRRVHVHALRPAREI